MTPSNIIDAKNLFIPVEHDGADYFQYKTLKDAEMPLRKTILQRSLKKITGIYQRTAEILDVERSNLHRKIKTYEIKVP